MTIRVRTAGMAVAAASMALLAAAAGIASAQDASKSPPAGTAPAAGWSATTIPGQESSGKAFDEKQIDAIKRVNAYFTGIANMRAQFVQTNPDAKRLRGKVSVKRPGRFRFDYNLPSKQIIISDGKYLAVQDTDINTDDRYELDRTPFRLLLRAEVDLLKDAKILDVQEAPDMLVVSLQDKSPDAPGRIKLFIATKPAMELKEWVTTDAQNLETRVELSGIDTTEDIDPKLFEIRSVAIQKLNQN